MTMQQERAGDGIGAAYVLAYRITGSQERAEQSVEAAAASAGLEPAALVRAARTEARRRRPAPPSAPVPRPEQLHAIAAADWDILERVALRGMTLTEAAGDAGFDRREALSRLNRAMAAARAALGGGDPRDQAQPVRIDGLDRKLPAGRLDDAARDGEPEPAPLGRVAG